MIAPTSRQHPIARDADESKNRPTVLFPTANLRSISAFGPRLTF